jgi:hypothetical protein
MIRVIQHLTDISGNRAKHLSMINNYLKDGQFTRRNKYLILEFVNNYLISEGITEDIVLMWDRSRLEWQVYYTENIKNL